MDALQWKPPPPKKVKGSTTQKAPVASYSLEFEEMQACAAMNISYADYLKMPGTQDWTDDVQPLSKCEILIWYRYRVRLQSIDAGLG